MTYYGRNDEWEDETTPAQWEKIRKLADAGDESRLIDYLFEIGTIDPRSAPLFVLAVAEHKRLAKIFTDGEGAEQQASQLQQQLEFLYRTQNIDPETHYQRVQELRTKIAELREKAGVADLAGRHNQSILEHFPRLFDLSPVGEGANLHWPPAVSQLSVPMYNMLRKLGLPQYKVEPFRDFAPMAMPSKPVRRIVSPLVAAEYFSH